MEAITIEQFRPIFEQQQYKHIGLFGDAGGTQRLVPYNPSTKKPAERLQEIERKLKGVAQPDGLYFILAKSSPKADVIPTVYPIRKGKIKPGESTHIHLSQGNQNGEMKMFTYAEALKMEVENSSLKDKTILLQDQIVALEKDVDDLTNQIDVDSENAQELSDKATPAWQTALADNIVPLMNTIAEDRKAERELEARKINLEAAKIQLKRDEMAARVNPQLLPQQGQQNEPLLWEDLNQEQIDGLDVTFKARLHNEYLARFSQSDPEGYEAYIKEHNLANV